MEQLEHFRNEGFGWVCKRCAEELAAANKNDAACGDAPDETTHARFMTEGEAESKSPELANPALARWLDASRQTLFCTRCSVSESVDQF